MNEQKKILSAMDILSNVEADDIVLDAIKVAINAMVDKLKFRFNEASDDIPDHEVMCYDKYGHHMIGYVVESDLGYFAENDGDEMYECIGWREIPKHDE